LIEAGNTAFLRLFRQVSGCNHSREKVAMTAPISLLIPPAPEDPQAAVRYSGSWSEQGYPRNEILIPVAASPE